ncbi:MAG TPA: nitronate monooxygenase [Actinomycetota bacterium]
MLRTPLSDLFGLEVPVIQAGMSIFTSPRLAAAVSNSGGLGSLGAWRRPADQLRRDLDELRGATARPFAVNHVVLDLDPAGFEFTLEAAPAVVSFALDDAGALMERVHQAGSLVMQQVTTVRQARVAVDHGADIIVAQGGEAGGYAGNVASLPLIPQVVDAVRPVPVVAAGGIADGRGLAAAIVLGAAGANLGTRFLASVEAPIEEEWKRAIVESPSEAWTQLLLEVEGEPDPQTSGYETRLRMLKTLSEEGGFAGGQSAGLIHDIPHAGDIVRTIGAEAERILAAARGR